MTSVYAQDVFIKTFHLQPQSIYDGGFIKIISNVNGINIIGRNNIIVADSAAHPLIDSVFENTQYTLNWNNSIAFNDSVFASVGLFAIYNYKSFGIFGLKDNNYNQQVMKAFSFDSISSTLSLTAIAQSNGQDYYLIGLLNIFISPTLSDYRFVLLKTDSIGNLKWSKTLSVNDNNYTFKRFNYIFKTNDGNLLIGGSLGLPIANSISTITKIDTAGNVIWAKKVVVEDDYPMQDMLLNDDGSMTLLRKETGKGAGLSKVDSAGNILWSKSYGGSSWCFGRALTKTSDGGYAIVSSVNGTFPGWTNDGIGLLKTDSIGNLQWRHDYSYSETRAVRSVAQTADGGYLIAGSQHNPNGGSDGLLIKTDSSGHVGSCYETTPPYFTQSFADSTVDIQVIVGNIELRDTTLTIYPDTSGTFTTLCETVGIEEQTLTYSPTAYPNPFTATLTVTHPAAKGSIFIIDITGKEVYRTAFTNSTEQQLQLEWLQPGMYFLTVSTNGVGSTNKIIKL